MYITICNLLLLSRNFFSIVFQNLIEDGIKKASVTNYSNYIHVFCLSVVDNEALCKIRCVWYTSNQAPLQLKAYHFPTAKF
jgi:hypothetical protein